LIAGHQSSETSDVGHVRSLALTEPSRRVWI
jgi:hypothetical protein